jgi:hypothetical protein
MTYRIMISVFALVFWSCTVDQESEKQFTNIELLEASLLELQKVGLVDTSVPFNERTFKNTDIFPNELKTPETIAGLAVVPLEYIFTNNEGIALNSINQKADVYEIIFWNFGDETYLVVELNSHLEALKVDRKEEL